MGKDRGKTRKGYQEEKIIYKCRRRWQSKLSKLSRKN